MGENSAIEWTDHTFNPWRGCARVSKGCENCYAETGSKRNPKVLGIWGVQGTRVVASEAMWRQPVKWNAEAEAAGERRRVFCASLADVGEDRPDLVAPRARLCEQIVNTPWLLWLLLTKRIENIARLFPAEILVRCGVGSTTENQPMYDKRIRDLLLTPAAFRFLSIEPMLGPIDLRMGGMSMPEYSPHDPLPQVDWVIVGGESGHHARPFDIAWPRSIVQQCRAAGVAPFVKQLGAYVTWDGIQGGYGDGPSNMWPRATGSHPDVAKGRFRKHLTDYRKGGDMAEWPEDLRVREMPRVATPA